MKVIKLSDEDHTLLKAAHDACKDTEQALAQAHKNNKQAQATYSKVLNQLKLKHKLDSSHAASDDQRFLIGYLREDATEPAPEEPTTQTPVELL